MPWGPGAGVPLRFMSKIAMPRNVDAPSTSAFVYRSPDIAIVQFLQIDQVCNMDSIVEAALCVRYNPDVR